MWDAALITHARAANISDTLFELADIIKDGKLHLKELQTCLLDVAKTCPRLDEYVKFLNNK